MNENDYNMFAITNKGTLGELKILLHDSVGGFLPVGHKTECKAEFKSRRIQSLCIAVTVFSINGVHGHTKIDPSQKGPTLSIYTGAYEKVSIPIEITVENPDILTISVEVTQKISKLTMMRLQSPPILVGYTFLPQY